MRGKGFPERATSLPGPEVLIISTGGSVTREKSPATATQGDVRKLAARIATAAELPASRAGLPAAASSITACFVLPVSLASATSTQSPRHRMVFLGQPGIPA